MKLSKEELYRLHHFFLPLDEFFFFFFFCALALLSFSSEEKEFFFSVVREKGRKKVFASRSAHSLFRPPSIPLPPLVLLPTPCESSFRSIEEDEIIGCAREERALASNYFVVVVVVCRQMWLTRAAGPYFLLLVSFCLL